MTNTTVIDAWTDIVNDTTEYTADDGSTWLLVNDGQSLYWLDPADLDADAMQQYHLDKTAVADLDDDATDTEYYAAHARVSAAYSTLCQAIPSTDESDVPADVVAEAREDLDCDDDEVVATV